jgi:hypothetical protein
MVSEPGSWHIVPINDLREHKSSKDCWCNPVQDEEESGIWVHNSMDGREHYDEAGKLH